MDNLFPRLKEKPFYLRLITLGLMLISGLLVFSLIAILGMIPFLGTGIMDRLLELNDLDNQETLNILKFIQIMNQIGLFIVPSVAFAWLYDRKTGSFLGTDRMPVGSVILLSVLMIGAMIPVINFMVEWNESIRLPELFRYAENWMRAKEDEANRITEAFLNAGNLSGFLVNFIMIGVLAAVGEELFFRGVLIRLSMDFIQNKHFAVWLTSLLFSALHLQFYGFFPRMLLGLIFGYIFIFTGNLWYPIIMHLLFNGLTVVVACLHARGSIETDAETFGNYTSPYIIAGSMIISAVFLWFIYKKGKQKAIPNIQ